MNDYDVLGKVMVVEGIMRVKTGWLAYNNGAIHPVCPVHPSMPVPEMGARVKGVKSGTNCRKKENLFYLFTLNLSSERIKTVAIIVTSLRLSSISGNGCRLQSL